MATIKSIEISMVDLKPETVRQDAIQIFVSQETPFVKITDSDGMVGYGYTYTIGRGGSSVVALIKDHLAPLLIGEEAENIERLWQKMLFHTMPRRWGDYLAVVSRFRYCSVGSPEPNERSYRFTDC